MVLLLKKELEKLPIPQQLELLSVALNKALADRKVRRVPDDRLDYATSDEFIFEKTRGDWWFFRHFETGNRVALGNGGEHLGRLFIPNVGSPGWQGRF